MTNRTAKRKAPLEVRIHKVVMLESGTDPTTYVLGKVGEALGFKNVEVFISPLDSNILVIRLDKHLPEDA